MQRRQNSVKSKYDVSNSTIPENPHTSNSTQNLTDDPEKVSLGESEQQHKTSNDAVNSQNKTDL